jgi:methionyl-tRNA formyltransferase
MPLRLVLMGTGPFAVPSFAALHEDGHSIVAVYTRPIVIGPGGRRSPGSPVRAWAQSHDLPMEDPENANAPEVVSRLQSFAADLLVVCDYGQILKRPTLATTKMGGINLHGSLLPAYRGAAPVQWAIWSGDQQSGVSVIHMTPRLDGGPILSVRTTEIGAQETAGQLEERLSQIGVDVVRESLQKLQQWDGTSQIGLPQDESRTSKAPRLSKADGWISWADPAVKIDCQIRAMQPWPGAYCECQPLNRQPVHLVVCQATPLLVSVAATPGTVLPDATIPDNQQMLVATGDGILRIDRLKAAGKREMTSAEYRRGNPLPPGSQMTLSQPKA